METQPYSYLGGVAAAQANLARVSEPGAGPSSLPLSADIIARSDLAIALSFIGEYDRAVAIFDEGAAEAPPRATPPLPSAPPDAVLVPAVEAISAAASSRRIVLINEAHHVPMHRALVLALLKRLKQEGFTHFGAEALSGTETGMYQAGFVPRSPYGVLVEEPIYADLVRAAIALGYKLVDYEANPDCKLTADAWMQCANAREIGQAENIIRGALSDDPDSKVLILAGYGHIAKPSPPGEVVPMAVWLMRQTGLDPLSVDQTILSPRGRPELEHPDYRRLVAGVPDIPAVIQSGENAYWASRPEVDISVIHPPASFDKGRPAWLRMGGIRRDAVIPDWLCGPVRPCLVQAFAEGEPPATSVPVDQVLLSAPDDAKVLVLPTGQFVIVGLTTGDRVVNSAPLSVAP